MGLARGGDLWWGRQRSALLAMILAAVVLVPGAAGARIPSSERGRAVVDAYPQWSPDGKRIAFYRSQGGVRFVIGRDGRGTRRLGRAAIDWAPDSGRSVIWSSRGIELATGDGSDRRMLDPNGRQPSWSPDGQQLVFARHAELVIARVDSGDIRVIDLGPLPCEGCGSGLSWPRWSPDGHAIAFFRYLFRAPAINVPAQLHVLDLDDGRLRRLPSIQGEEWSSPNWSPDARWIYFFGALDTTNSARTQRLNVVRVDGSEERRERAPVLARWGPTGHTLATIVAARRQTSLVIRTLDTARSIVIPRVSEFSWAPDGKRLAIERNGSIYTASSTGRNIRFLARGRSPAWSPVGNEVAYAGDCRRGGGIHIANVQTLRTRRLTRPCR